MSLDSDLSQSDGDFGFAFNNVNFSDRLLRIEIIRGHDDVSCSSVVDCVRDRKRRRLNHVLDLASSCQMDSENNNKKREELDRESQSGGEDETEYDCKLTNPSVSRVQELYISSPILAAKSPFFLKMFSNGMLESEQKHLTLKIDESEEAAVMELLNFMYRNRLSVTTVPALLDVLMAADKFEVASCMKLCSRLLLDMTMTLDFALLVLDLPSSLLMAEPVKPLVDSATHFIASRYKDIAKFPLEEVMALPLVCMETILANDDLQVPSEDLAYELALKWVKSHYTLLEERQDILGSHLSRFIRFPHMSRRRLKQILTSDDLKPSVASKLVLEALFHKLESVQPASKRAYNYIYKPIRVMEFEVPRHQCIVFLELNRKECMGLYPSGRVCSQGFNLGGQWFFLSAHCNMDELNFFHCFGLFLGMQEKGPVSLTVEYEFSARSKPTEEFVRRYKGKYQFTGGKAVGYRNLLAIPWDSFIAKDCPHFIDDVLYLRADLSIRV